MHFLHPVFRYLIFAGQTLCLTWELNMIFLGSAWLKRVSTLYDDGTTYQRHLITVLAGFEHRQIHHHVMR
jgi:hypothetical protein